MNQTILFVALVVAGGCGNKKAKPEEKLVESTAPLEALGFTFDRPANVKLGEARPQTQDTCCMRVDIHAATGYIGAFSTLNVPWHYKTLDEYVAGRHDGNTVVTKETLANGAFYVEFREPHDSPKSPVRIASGLTSATSSADCYATPAEEELELARSICRSLRVKP